MWLFKSSKPDVSPFDCPSQKIMCSGEGCYRIFWQITELVKRDKFHYCHICGPKRRQRIEEIKQAIREIEAENQAQTGAEGKA